MQVGGVPALTWLLVASMWLPRGVSGYKSVEIRGSRLGKPGFRGTKGVLGSESALDPLPGVCFGLADPVDNWHNVCREFARLTLSERSD